MSGLSDMVVLLPAIYLMGKLDMTDPDTIQMLRIGYGSLTVLVAAVWLFVAFRIKSSNNQTKIKVEQAPSLSQPQATKVEMTIQDYDMSQVKEAFNTLLFGAAIVGFLHYKWEMAQPLFMQLFMTPMSIFKHGLFQIYVLGKDVARPFKKDNPFAALMPKPEQDDAEQEQPAQEAKKDK